jgi:glycerophosphoryl diester phosphodiesterase
LNTTAGSRFVNHSIAPVSSFQSAQGFFNIAHRGASFYAPENTFPAFQKALEMKADLIELDVTLTRDKVPVVFHDEKLHRTTNGKGDVQNYFERELNELDAGNWFSSEYKGTQIPRLEDVLKWASGTISLNIEIKKEAVTTAQKNGIVDCINELVIEHNMSEQVIISSFSGEALRRFRDISPEIPTAYLISSYSFGTTKAYQLMKTMNASGLNMKPRQMRKKLMQLVKKNKVPVWVYTVDEADEMADVIKKGATGIFTNRPDLLRQVASRVLKNHQK